MTDLAWLDYCVTRPAPEGQCACGAAADVRLAEGVACCDCWLGAERRPVEELAAAA